MAAYIYIHIYFYIYIYIYFYISIYVTYTNIHIYISLALVGANHIGTFPHVDHRVGVGFFPDGAVYNVATSKEARRTG
jgi:hypothetical protein